MKKIIERCAILSVAVISLSAAFLDLVVGLEELEEDAIKAAIEFVCAALCFALGFLYLGWLVKEGKEKSDEKED